MSGASGLIGTALSSHLTADGHTVTRLVRREAKPGEVTWDPAAGMLDPARVRRLRRGDQPVGRRHRRQALDRRLQAGTALEPAADHRAVGKHHGRRSTARRPCSSPDRPSAGTEIAATSDSTSCRSSGDDFLSDLCQQWEAATLAAEKAGIRTVHLRIGHRPVGQGWRARRGNSRCSSSASVAASATAINGRAGSRSTTRSRAIAHLLSAEMCGAVNLTAPNPVTNSEFTTTLAKVLHRPAVIPIPTFGPKMLLGGELVEALLLAGQRVLTDRAAAQRLRVPARDVGRGAPSTCCTASRRRLLVRGVDRGPAGQLGVEVEPFGARPGWPVLLRHRPHHLELDAVGIVAVQALADTVIALADQRRRRRATWRAAPQVPRSC